MEKQKPTWAWSTSILTDILNFNMKLDEQLNNKSNFLMGASALIIIFTVGVITKNEFLSYARALKIGWAVIGVGSFLTFLMAIMIITPKIRIIRKKERIKEDVIYYKNITKFYSREQYIQELSDVIWNKDKITRAFGNQIYSLSDNILPFKSRLLKRAGWTFLISLVIGIGLIMVNMFL